MDGRRPSVTELLERESKSAADPSAALVERITRVLLGQGPARGDGGTHLPSPGTAGEVAARGGRLPRSRGRAAGARRGRRRGPTPRRREVPWSDQPLHADMAVPVIELAASRMWAGARGRARRRAADVAQEVGFPTSGTVDPILAGSLLHALHDVLLEEAGAAAQALSPFAWLWYLRRLPASVFAGEWATTEPYDLMLAETLSAASLRPEPPLPTTRGVVAFDLDDTALRPVFELCGWVAAISAVQSTIRRAGKGMSVSLGAEGLPWSVEDGVVGPAVELYDRRVEQDRGALVAGTESLARLGEESETLPLLCAQRLSAWQDVPGWEGRIVDRRGLLRLHGRWLVDMLTVDRLVQMLSGTGGEAEGWWDPGLPALVLLLRAMNLDAVHDSEVAGLTPDPPTVLDR
jgi:hypothetical protein